MASLREENGGGDEEPEAEAGLFGSEIGANLPRALAAESVGTFLLVFTGTAVACAGALGRATAGGAYDSLAVALAFGFALLIVAAALGHISGAHVNPAVTVGLAGSRKFPWRLVPAYVVAQVIGACLGALATWAVLGTEARTKAHLAAPHPSSGISDVHTLGVEALITFVLVIVVVSVATDPRVSAATTSIGVGFALTAAVFIGGPISGGGANPARALGPMIVAGKFTSFWVYILGPLVGGVAAALLFDMISVPRPRTSR